MTCATLQKPHSKSGFTLVELAIVMVVIGLIIGGVLVGKDMIRASELQSVVKDIEQFKIATNNFKLKYRALPGDMPNATQYWGPAPVCSLSDASAYSVVNTGTCNGDGNGQIIISADSTSIEFIRYWQHLSLSQMLPGTYSGLGTSLAAPMQLVPDISAPRSRTNGLYYLYYQSVLSGTGPAGIFPGEYNHFITLGPLTAPGGIPFNEGLMTAIDAYGIDKKMDDGKPGTGAVVSNTAPDCVSTFVPETSVYNVNLPEPACNLRFRNIF